MHRECCYVAGVTPLVAWLKQDMVHETLLLADKDPADTEPSDVTILED